MDASQYKDYVLALLFVKYVSDKYAGQPYALIKVPAGGGFADMQAAKGKPDIGERMNTIIKTLAKENNLTGIIDTADFDDKSKLGDGSEMQVTLTNLVAIFEDHSLDFSKNRAEGDDLLGDAYEYLMRNFATQSGKSKGQFYTPAEVSRVMAKIIGIEKATSSQQTIYDPTCGSGSLLLKAADEAPVDVTIYGQENDVATRALAKMNMILHDNTTARIERGNTISNPLFREHGQLQTFDFAVANPPFSTKAWSNGIKPEEDEFSRFVDGIPPKKNGDYAFLQHLVRSLKSKGKGAIILPHGVLFRGNAKADTGKFTKKSVSDRLKALDPDNPDDADERALVTHLQRSQDAEADLKKRIKTAQDVLVKTVTEKYPTLTEDEIKGLVVDDKWLAVLATDIQKELDRVSQTLTGRIKQLAERYATPLPQLTKRAQILSEKVDAHLKKMGYDVQ